MPVRSAGQRHRPVTRTVGGGWTDVNVYQRNAANTGWDVISLGLPNLTTSGSGQSLIFQNEPAPANRQVTNGDVVVAPTGGFGPFTYTWTRTGGSAAMTIISNASTGQPTFSATVPKNTAVNSTWRCDVYDQMTGRTESLTRTIDLQYATNL